MTITKLIEFLQNNLVNKRTDVTTPRTSLQYSCGLGNRLEDEIEVRACDYHEYYIYTHRGMVVLIHTVGNIKIFDNQLLVSKPTIKLFVCPTLPIMNIYNTPLKNAKIIEAIESSNIDLAPNINAIKERISLTSTKLFDKQIMIETTECRNLVNYHIPTKKNLTDDFAYRVIPDGNIKINNGLVTSEYSNVNNRHYYRFDCWIKLESSREYLENITLIRKGEENITFTGLVLCRVNKYPLHYDVNTFYLCLELYISTSGSLIAVKKEIIKNEHYDIKETINTKIINSINDLVQFFGMSDTAKMLYEKVSINHSVYI